MRRRHRRDQAGAVAVMVAFLSVALFILASLVVDLGNARDVRQQAQAAADASALAAVNVLYLNGGVVPQTTQAVNAVKNYATDNYGVTAAQWSSCTDPSALSYQPDPTTHCISFDQSARPTTVRVKMPIRRISTPFASLIGVRNVPVAAKAHATLSLFPKAQCGLCILGTTTHILQNGGVTVSGGNIDFNGSVTVNSNGLVATDGSILVQGTASGPLSSYDPDPVVGQPPVVDPLKTLALPPDMSSLTVKSNPCTDGPGKYGGFGFPNSTCTLSPGLYVIAGPGSPATEWKLTGNTSQMLAGDGVTLYFTCGTPDTPVACAPGVTGADLDATGNGQLAIKAPTTGALAGLALIYDRNNTATFRLNGNGATGLRGTIYMPSGNLQMGGNGCAQPINALLVVGDLSMNGTGACLNSAYAPSQNVSLSPTDMHLTQ